MENSLPSHFLTKYPLIKILSNFNLLLILITTRQILQNKVSFFIITITRGTITVTIITVHRMLPVVSFFGVLQL